MKKHFLLGIFLLFVSSSFAQTFNVDGIKYNVISSTEPYTVEVTSKLPNYEGDIIIPEQVQYNSQMYAVTGIDENAFSNSSNLTSIEIPNSVTSIGNGGFTSCFSLTSIVIPNSVTSIGNYTFYDCLKLTSIQLPNSITSIGYRTFYLCTMLTSIEIPNSVTSIETEAFSNCIKLTSILMPNSITNIGDMAFKSCSSLTSVMLPNTLTNIGKFAFSYCKKLTSIEVSTNNMHYASIDGVLYNKEKTLLIIYPGGRLGDFAIPNSVMSIGEFTFYGCTGLTTVAIPNSVTSIGSRAFASCSSLTAIEIPNSVMSIGFSALDGCSNLTAIVLPNYVASIDSTVFSGCSSLTSIKIPNFVTSIGSRAFSNCTALSSINCHSAIPPVLGRNVFSDVPKNIPLYVPYNSVQLYKQADQWKDFIILPLPPIIGSGENLVSGRLYLDANANAAKDNAERGLSQQKILILPDSVYAQTENAGNYTFRCDTGNYQIKLVLPDNWQATTVAMYDVAVSAPDTSGFDFGMAAIHEERHSEVTITSLDAGRCFEPVPVYLTYNNTGTSIENGLLKFYPDSQFGAILKATPAYDSLSADSSIVYWKMSDVLPFEERNVMLQMQMPDFTAMGDTLVSVLAFEDKDSVQNTDTAQLLVRCSYDPNDKQVSPAGVLDEHFVLMSEPLEFTIRFQNTGNDVANRVVILDSLSQHLDLATFQVIASSHNVKTNRSNEGVVEFRFDNIMLVDSSVNEPASHGFVKYRVKAKSNLPDNTIVENTSHIFFDYNPAIVTNTTSITMTYKLPQLKVLRRAIPDNVGVRLRPNPFSKTALLEFENPDKDVFELQISDVLGKIQQTEKSHNNFIVLERKDMPQGMYFYTLRNTITDKSYTGSFVVE